MLTGTGLAVLPHHAFQVVVGPSKPSRDMRLQGSVTYRVFLTFPHCMSLPGCAFSRWWTQDFVATPSRRGLS